MIIIITDDSNDAAQKQILDELETIDDDLDQHGIPFVKTDDIEFVKKYGFKSADLPLLIYFENGIPQFYKGSRKFSFTPFCHVGQNKLRTIIRLE